MPTCPPIDKTKLERQVIWFDITAKLVHGVAPFGLEVKTISTSTLPGRATPFY